MGPHPPTTRREPRPGKAKQRPDDRRHGPARHCSSLPSPISVSRPAHAPDRVLMGRRQRQGQRSSISGSNYIWNWTGQAHLHWPVSPLVTRHSGQRGLSVHSTGCMPCPATIYPHLKPNSRHRVLTVEVMSNTAQGATAHTHSQTGTRWGTGLRVSILPSVPMLDSRNEAVPAAHLV